MGRRLLTQFGRGSSLRRQDYTEAAVRAVRDALWHNSINIAELYGAERDAMRITVEIAVARPEEVDCAAVAAVFPYGVPEVQAVFGGLDVPRPAEGPDADGAPTVMALAAISVALEGV